jgi:prophage regulatory protein
MIPLQITQRAPEKIVRLPVVLSRTGLSRSSIYLKVNQSVFPAPVSLGARAIGWMESQIDSWILSRHHKQ